MKARPVAAADDAVSAELRALEDAFSSAILTNDPNRIAEFMTDDWVLVSESGVTSRERFLSVIGAGTLTHEAMRPLGEAQVRRYGDTALLTVRVTSRATWEGQSFDADEWTTDVFVYGDARWRCALTHLTAVRPRSE